MEIKMNKSSRTRRDISRAFVDLLLEKDFADISIIDICEKSMITRATFYKYFEDKFHLASCIIDDYKNQIVEEKFKNYHYSNPQELFMYIATICLDLIEQNQKTLTIIYSHCKKQKIIEQILEIIDFNISEILREQKNGVEYKVPIKILATFFSGGLTKLAFATLENPNTFKRADIMDFLALEIFNNKFIEEKK